MEKLSDCSFIKLQFVTSTNVPVANSVAYASQSAEHYFLDDNGDLANVTANSVTATSHVTTGGSSTQAVRGDGSLSVGYKVYTALLSQTSTNAPVATVLENTLGGTLVWSRVNTGEYRATLSGVFTVNKTVTFVNQGATSPLADIRFNRQDLNGCTLRTFAHSTSTPLEGGYLINGVTMLEIRVYN